MPAQPRTDELPGEGPEREKTAFPLSGPPVLILAAGASRRMGRCKLTLPLGDGLLITPTLRLARSVGNAALVVLPPEPAPGLREEVERHGLLWVTAHEAAKGQAESLKAGLSEVMRRWPQAPGVLVLLGDQPLLPEQAVREVLAAFASHPECAVLAAYHGQRGHPVILPEAAFADVLRLSGDTGARNVLKKFSPRLVEADTPGVILDVDEAEAYARLSCADDRNGQGL